MKVMEEFTGMLSRARRIQLDGDRNRMSLSSANANRGGFVNTEIIIQHQRDEFQVFEIQAQKSDFTSAKDYQVIGRIKSKLILI